MKASKHFPATSRRIATYMRTGSSSVPPMSQTRCSRSVPSLLWLLFFDYLVLWFLFSTQQSNFFLRCAFGFASVGQYLWSIRHLPFQPETPPPDTPSTEPTPETPQIEREALLYLEHYRFETEYQNHQNTVNGDNSGNDRRRRLFPVRELSQNQHGAAHEAQSFR